MPRPSGPGAAASPPSGHPRRCAYGQSTHGSNSIFWRRNSGETLVKVR